jgi:hypothetical protein
MSENDLDPALREYVHRVVESTVPGADAEARILNSVHATALGTGSQPERRSLYFGRPLWAVAIAVLTAAVVAGSLVVGFAVLARPARSPVHPPPVSARATPTASAVPSPSASPVTPTSAQWVSRFVPVGDVGAIVLGPASAYVIVNPTTQNGGYSPALAQIDRINRSNGAVDHGGTFPGAVSLALAGGYLWVATGPSPGVASTKANLLLRLNPLTLAVEQRTSIAELGGTNNLEPPDLAAAGNMLWIGYGPHVARLSAASGATIWTRNVGGTGSVSSVSVDSIGRLLYVGFDSDRPSIAELNATTGATLAESSAYFGYDLGGPQLAAFIGDVWVAYATGNDGTNVELQASNLTPSAGGVSGLHTNGIDVFRGNGILWMSDGMAGELFCADEATGAVRASFDWPLGGLIAADSAGTVVGGYSGVSFLRTDPRCYS